MRCASRVIAFFGVLLATTLTFGQSTSNPTDSQTLQALLQEVRQLRQDLRTVTVTTERAQIILSRLQAQQAAVTSAQREHDAARSRLTQAQRRSKEIESQMKYYTDQDSEDKTPNATDRQNIEDMIGRLKSTLEDATADEQDAQSNEMQTKDKLQIEQSKLSALQDELDQIDKGLEELANQRIN
jgi:chromosome segregation ATPase